MFDTIATLCVSHKNLVCECFAAVGNLNGLMIAHKLGLPWRDACYYAAGAKTGKIDCLQYLHENGCPSWYNTECHHASEYGNLDCLQYLHKNGCVVWDEWT